MGMKQIVRLDYAECIQLMTNMPSELKRALRTSERVPVFVDRLADELTKAESAGVKLSRERIKSTVYEMTEFFASNLKRSADKKAAVEHDKLAAQLDAQGNGTDENLGVTIVDRAEP